MPPERWGRAVKAPQSMTKPPLQSNLGFRLMSLEFRIRDWLHPPIRILQEAGVRSGMTVLDFGCGPGGFSLAAAGVVGPEGHVYALDIHPLAVRSVQCLAARRGFSNIQTILANNMAELGTRSIDIVLLYDVLHHIREPIPTLGEIRGVLKSEGVLSVNDHHLSEEVLLARITTGGYFRLTGHGTWTYRFEPTNTNDTAR
jgi:ubiquinone/menaquinone biosynthesis C-methylase UbiE